MNSISILGCGWLGEPLAYHFVQKGEVVKGSSRSIEKLQRLKKNGVAAHSVDCTLDLKNSLFFDSQILVICLTNKDVTLAKHLISVIAASNVQKVIFVSSTSVYRSEDMEVTENSPLVDSPLVEIEGLFRSSPDFETTIVRFAGLVGGERHPGRFFAKGNPLKSPKASVNLIHLDDCIQIIDAIVTQESWGEIYNGCSTTHACKGEFYQKVARSGGFPIPNVVDTVTKDKIISNKKILKELSIDLVYPDLLEIYG